MSDGFLASKRCQTLHVPSGRQCEHFDGHTQPHFARVNNEPKEWGNAELEVLFACNDPGNGVFKGHFEEVAFCLKGDTVAALEGPRKTIAFYPERVVILFGARQLDCARTSDTFASRNHLNWAGNWTWDSVRMHEDIARMLLVQLFAAGYTVTEGADEGPLAELIAEMAKARKAVGNG